MKTEDVRLGHEITRVVALGDPHGDLDGLERVLSIEEKPGTTIVSVGDNVGYEDAKQSSELCRRLKKKGIKSIFGNHEDWSDHEDGELFLVTKRGPKVLDRDALAYMNSLPARLRLMLAARPSLKASVVHTITGETRDGQLAYDYLSVENVETLAHREGSDVIFCGHSHGPTIWRIAPDGALKVTRLELVGEEEASVPLHDDWRYVIDCGSVGRPGYHPGPERTRLATYGFLDLNKKVVGIRSVKKD